jgi:hypothetical protein
MRIGECSFLPLRIVVAASLVRGFMLEIDVEVDDVDVSKFTGINIISITSSSSTISLRRYFVMKYAKSSLYPPLLEL